jgi:hypothetical protein
MKKIRQISSTNPNALKLKKIQKKRPSQQDWNLDLNAAMKVAWRVSQERAD